MGYILSKLTFKYYSLVDDVYLEIPIDDSNQQYKTMISSQQITEVESLPFEIQDLDKTKVPKEISRMKFKMQIRRSTNYTYEIIIAYIQSIPVSLNFTEEMKQDILDRLEDCVKFERYSPDFIMLANMMGVSDAKKDEIFIEGNKID